MKAKQIICEYHKKYKKIAVVSHFYICRTLIAEEFASDGEIVNPKIIFNAVPYRTSVEEIMKYK